MYLQRFNEVSTFIEPQPFAPILTDACAAVGGTFLNNDFMYRRWDSDVPSVQDCAINYKEAMIAAISISRRQANLGSDDCSHLYQQTAG